MRPILEYLGGIETFIFWRIWRGTTNWILEYLGGIETSGSSKEKQAKLEILEYLGGIETLYALGKIQKGRARF